MLVVRREETKGLSTLLLRRLALGLLAAPTVERWRLVTLRCVGRNVCVCVCYLQWTLW